MGEIASADKVDAFNLGPGGKTGKVGVFTGGPGIGRVDMEISEKIHRGPFPF